MILFTAHKTFNSTLKASFAMEAGRTLRWKPVAERRAILRYLMVHWLWTRRELKAYWLPLKALHSKKSGLWTKAENAEARRLMEAFDLRLTALLQQAWIRILLAKK